MTTQQFNDLLDTEVKLTAGFYRESTHYEPYPYMAILADGPAGTTVRYEETINPGDIAEMGVFLRRVGANFALDHVVRPAAIFVAVPSIGLNLQQPGLAPKRVMAITGIAADTQHNVGVLEAQWDEDGRLYLEPLEVVHAEPGKQINVNLDFWSRFFTSNAQMHDKLAALQPTTA